MKLLLWPEKMIEPRAQTRNLYQRFANMKPVLPNAEKQAIGVNGEQR